MIVARPETDQRQSLETAALDLAAGLQGDNWASRGSASTPDGRAHPEAQITLMNARAIQAAAKDRARWPLAGDQLFVDLDISQENLAPGDRLEIGSAVLEITPRPHTGCAKFTDRFGHAAIRWVNSPQGRELRLRGVYARVVQPGSIHVGDAVVVRRTHPIGVMCGIGD
jgi:MOSC domain-containing protein YiiM